MAFLSQHGCIDGHVGKKKCRDLSCREGGFSETADPMPICGPSVSIGRTPVRPNGPSTECSAFTLFASSLPLDAWRNICTIHSVIQVQTGRHPGVVLFLSCLTYQQIHHYSSDLCPPRGPRAPTRSPCLCSHHPVSSALHTKACRHLKVVNDVMLMNLTLFQLFQE